MPWVFIPHDHQGDAWKMLLIIPHQLCDTLEAGVLVNTLVHDSIMGPSCLRIDSPKDHSTPSLACRRDFLSGSHRTPTRAHFAKERQDAFIFKQHNNLAVASLLQVRQHLLREARALRIPCLILRIGIPLFASRPTVADESMQLLSNPFSRKRDVEACEEIRAQGAGRPLDKAIAQRFRPFPYPCGKPLPLFSLSLRHTTRIGGPI